MYYENLVNNYIDVSVSATLQASTRRRNNAKALLDTGSLAGNFVTSRAVHLDPFILTDRSKLVCSGLDNSCYDVSSYITQQRDLAASQTQGMLGALVDRSDNLLMKAAADVDEIDMVSSDTFLPWSPVFFEAGPLSKLHIFGDGDQRKQILALCGEFRDIFSNEFDETPALVPPFDLKVDDTKWKVRANRAPPRPQTPSESS
jgi:hypothetical protein